ncbi:MAG: hypothetical protein EA383_14860, partial [Spirochaetaceae bacterium]
AFKLFQGGDEQSILATARAMFEKARIVKPKACRDESFEVFLVCNGKKAPPRSVTERSENNDA